MGPACQLCWLDVYVSGPVTGGYGPGGLPHPFTDGSFEPVPVREFLP